MNATPTTDNSNNNNDYQYNCVAANDEACAISCVSLQECNDCNCVVQPTVAAEGPWGDVLDVLFSLLPILVLLVVTVKPHNPWPTTQSLPTAAGILFVVRLAYFASDPLLTCSAVVTGLLEALTPLSIMAGAILLFQTMEATLCLPYMMRELQVLTAGHHVAELLLLFAFGYAVEGASGFGTPVALAAPMLVRTGQPALGSVVTLLVMNTFATVWGAVGTPLWFGFNSTNNWSDDDLLAVSQKAAVALAVAAVLVMPTLLTVLVPWRTVRANLVFVYAALAVTVGPSVGIAHFNYEFPALMGGLVGCALTAVLIWFRVGMVTVVEDESDNAAAGSVDGNNNNNNDEPKNDSDTNHMEDATEEDSRPAAELPETYDDDDDDDEEAMNTPSKRSIIPEQPFSSHDDFVAANDDDGLAPRKVWGDGYLQESLWRTFPIWGVVLLLILTRIEQIGLKEHLISRDDYFSIHFGTLGTFRLSTSLVLELRDILTYPNKNWKYVVLGLCACVVCMFAIVSFDWTPVHTDSHTQLISFFFPF